MLVYETPFSIFFRALLFLFSLLPLWGAYDLLFSLHFSSYFNFAFLFLLVMAIGCLGVFAGFFCGAIFGITQTVTFDPGARKVTRRWRNILPRQHVEELPFIYVRDIEVVTHAMSEGPDEYTLRLHPTAGDEFEFTRFTVRKGAVAEAAKLRVMLGLPAET